MAAFTGFPMETLALLAGLKANNSKEWFTAHRPLYDASVEAAKAFVDTVGPELKSFAPAINYEAKIGASLQRPNRDIRFSKDKRLYKEQIDLWFWHGDKRSWEQPGFWFSLTPKAVYCGSGLYIFQGERLDAYRQSVIHPRSGKALAAMVAGLAAKGYAVEGKTRKRLPAGFETDADRVEFLFYEGLYATVEMPIAAAAKPGFSDVVLAHLEATKPVNDWLLAEVVD